MLKDFIQWLLNTRTTPAEAAHVSRSTFSSPVTFSGKTSAGEAWTDNLVTGISPKDGYLNISASTVNSENFGTMLQVTSNEVQLSQVSSTSGQGLNFLLPITKGAQFSVNGIRAKDIAVRFFESLGGGYNNLLKEVQLCLRTSCNFCLKLLSRVSTKILPTKLEASTQVLYTLPLPKENLDIQLQKLDTLPSEFLQPKTHGSELKMEAPELVTLQTQRVLGNIVQYLQRKETQWYSILAKVPTLLNALVTLFLVLPRHNRVVGGLAC